MKEKLKSFSRGRNGLDTWNYILIVLTIALIILSLAITNYIPLIAAGICVIVFLFRALSRNLEKRGKEDAVFGKIGKFFKKHRRLAHSKWKDRHTHVYKKCPKCKNMLRMKRHKGVKNITCPYCGNNFDVKIHFASTDEKQQKKAQKTAEKAAKDAEQTN